MSLLGHDHCFVMLVMMEDYYCLLMFVEVRLVLVHDHCLLVMTLMRMENHCLFVRVMMFLEGPVVQLL